MSLETALAVTNSEGVRYGDLESEALSNMTVGIGKALAKSSLAPEKRDELLYKQDAIRVILQSRN